MLITQTKWINDLNLRPEAQKLLEENMSSILSDISLGNIFLDTCPQAMETKSKEK